MIRFLIDGVVWTGRSGRTRLLIALLIWIALFGTQIYLRANGLGFSATSILIWIVLAFWTYLTIGHGVRRLHDLGLSGGWFVLGFVPYLGPAFLGLWLLVPSRDRLYAPAGPVANMVGFLLTSFLCITILSRAFWEPYQITSGHMKPTLQPGDYIVVTPKTGAPDRGDVVVFLDKRRGVEQVARVIGQPGDTVQMQQGRPVLSGAALAHEPLGQFAEVFERQGPLQAFPRCMNQGVGIGAECFKDIEKETLPSGRSYFVLNIGDVPLDNTPEFTVPDGSYFLLGDNRDNAADSRLSSAALGMGFVEEVRITGFVRRVLVGMHGQTLLTPWNWRPERFLAGVQ